MNNALNLLQQYMDFYRNSGASKDYSIHSNYAMSGFNPTPYNPNAEALSWATRMLQDQRPGAGPDFFSGGREGGNENNPALAQGYRPPPAYVQPQQPASAGFFSPAQQQPLTGQVNNYLAALLRK